MGRQGWFGVAAQMAELALVNQVEQLTHQVDDVTTDQLMTTPYIRCNVLEQARNITICSTAILQYNTHDV